MFANAINARHSQRRSLYALNAKQGCFMSVLLAVATTTHQSQCWSKTFAPDAVSAQKTSTLAHHHRRRTMPLKQHPTDPDKMVYVSRQYDIPQPQGIPQLQGVTTARRPWVGLTDEDCKGMSAGDRVVAMWADRTLKEKNT